MEVNKKHVVQLQGKDFITYDGLLDMAHQMGIVSIETELIDKDPYIFRAVAKTETQTFTGYGDADNGNVNSMIAKHKIRMAETRAKARALRDLTNVGMCSVEEMGGDDAPAKRVTVETAKQVFSGELSDDDKEFIDKQLEGGGDCASCGADMTDGQKKVSMSKYSKHLCPKCQKEVK